MRIRLDMYEQSIAGDGIPLRWGNRALINRAEIRKMGRMTQRSNPNFAPHTYSAILLGCK